MKKMHLLCNAHLDPVWLWQRNEGIAEAISTFRVAADFCEKYDGFVFNHNEALLYEWVEEHEPQLFARIQKLVKAGKWRIMGGWYLQPDCVLTSGESLLSQIDLGRRYFKEKFGATPTTAINFDPFGHSRGLVQILAKSGFDSYLFMRPSNFKGDFIWEGLDGTRIKAHGIRGAYNAPKNRAAQKVLKKLEELNELDIGLVLWGIGNHGGGPSKKDLEDINALIKQTKDVEIVHSSAEAYFAEIDQRDLPVISTSLTPCMEGCYTSMVRIKQANRRLENLIALTEKAMSYANMTQGLPFDTAELDKAKKALAFCQFHDILPGSAIQPVEEDSLRTLSYAEETVENLYTKAFFRLCSGQKKAKEGEIPVMVFNPHPYEVEGDFSVSYMLQEQNWNEDEVTVGQVVTADGTELPTQDEKPACTFNLDWPKRISFHAKLAPSSVNRFDCKLTVKKKDTLPTYSYESDRFAVRTDRMYVAISRKTGLIEQLEIDGKQRLMPNSGAIEVYRDNEDPWGMTPASFGEQLGSFVLMPEEEVSAFLGYPDEPIQNPCVAEDGAVRLKLQAFFKHGCSVAVVEYTVPKQGAYVDIDLTVHSNEVHRMLKYRFDTAFSGVPQGEIAFGRENMFDDGHESVFHKWCGIENGDDRLYILNKGTYGGSFTPNTVRLTLLRTPMYSAHPLNTRQIAPHDRWIEHIDMGERRFSFRLCADADVASAAQCFNEEPRLLSFFPDGSGTLSDLGAVLDCRDVLLSSIRKTQSGYLVTLYNTANEVRDTTLRLPALQKQLDLHFEKYELKRLEIN